MNLPKDVSGRELIKKLRKLGYERTRQSGSHIRITTQEHGEHHVTVPDHKSLKIGTLSSILKEVAQHFGMDKNDLIDRLF